MINIQEVQNLREKVSGEIIELLVRHVMEYRHGVEESVYEYLCRVDEGHYDGYLLNWEDHYKEYNNIEQFLHDNCPPELYDVYKQRIMHDIEIKRGVKFSRFKDKVNESEVFDKYFNELIEKILNEIYELVNEKFEDYNTKDYLNTWDNYLLYLADAYHNLITSADYSYNLCDIIFQIIDGICKTNILRNRSSLFAYSEINNTILEFSKLNNEEIFNKGLELLKENSIKYLVVVNEMNDTRIRAILIYLLNIVYDRQNNMEYLKTRIDDLCNERSSAKYFRGFRSMISQLNDGYDINLIKDACDDHGNLKGKKEIYVFKIAHELIHNGNDKKSYYTKLLDILKRYKYNYDLIDSDGNNLIMFVIKYYDEINSHRTFKWYDLSAMAYLVLELLKTNFNLYQRNNDGETLYDIAIKTFDSKNEVIKELNKLYGIENVDIDNEFNEKLKEVDDFVLSYKHTTKTVLNEIIKAKY